MMKSSGKYDTGVLDVYKRQQMSRDDRDLMGQDEKDKKNKKDKKSKEDNKKEDKMDGGIINGSI